MSLHPALSGFTISDRREPGGGIGSRTKRKKGKKGGSVV